MIRANRIATNTELFRRQIDWAHFITSLTEFSVLNGCLKFIVFKWEARARVRVQIILIILYVWLASLWILFPVQTTCFNALPLYLSNVYQVPACDSEWKNSFFSAAVAAFSWLLFAHWLILPLDFLLLALSRFAFSVFARFLPLRRTINFQDNSIRRNILGSV